MTSDSKTELQRNILLAWYENPDATNKEIADYCDCSASYVSQVKNRFDDYNQMEAMMDRQDREMEQMFGEDIFSGTTAGGNSGVTTGQQPGLADTYEDLPDNMAGNVGRALILIIMLYVVYEVLNILVL